jgi:hypothetical protein
MWFRRITIIEDVDPPPHAPVPTPWRSKSEFGKSGFTGTVSGLVRPGKRRLAPNDVDGDDDPREFKRVRMISKKRQIKQRHFGNIRANGGLNTFSALSNASSPAISTLRFPMPESKTPMMPGDVTAKPEASKEAFLDLAEVVRRDLEIARQMGILRVLKVKSDPDLPVEHYKDVPATATTPRSEEAPAYKDRSLELATNPWKRKFKIWKTPLEDHLHIASPHSMPVNDRISSTSTHTNEPGSPPNEHYFNPYLDVSFCQECGSEWYRYERRIGCPKCGSTEVFESSLASQKALSRAAEGGHGAVVKMLLETGKVDVNLKDKDGQTPLSRAVSNGYEAVVKMLLETSNVDVNLKDKDGQMPFSRAVSKGHEAIVKMFLRTGKVDVNLKDKDGQTPLSRAVSNGYEAIVKMLLETGNVTLT